MKNTTRLLIGLTLLLYMSSCHDDYVEFEELGNYQITNANELEINGVNYWIKKKLNTRIESHYDIDNLKKVADIKNDVYLFTVISTENSDMAVSFVPDPSGEIKFGFKSKTIKNDKDQFFCEIYSLEDELKLAYIDYPDGTREIVFTETVNSNERMEGFWSNWDKCVGLFHELTGSVIGDIAVTAVFNAATAGLYTPLSIVMCAAVAALQ